ncbi:LOW QUALITY PROTEIN: radial spoke head protein 3 homolog [Prionailurus viverrinus]|uniref:LOW QUALITY PROTEIN: radial spoke head protein 3 homolog n=1 Tax=Prionailurus viverrinus TaxID=61388 RepID=UPI001FF34A37|nr:LOW QUALITY PROTEIN: radial spoke head protein 3 homolog [Prionailurus viverrinus]
MQTGLRSAPRRRRGGGAGRRQEALPRPWHVTELGARVPRVCDDRNGSTWAWENGAEKPDSKLGTRTAAVPAKILNTALPDSPSRELLIRRRTFRGGARARAEQEPEVPLRTGLPAKTAGRNCQEVPPPGGTPGCRATAVGDAGWLSVPWGKPNVAPTFCPGNFLSRPPSFLPPLLASGNPCPWQYVHLSGSLDRLAPTCLKAGIHPKRATWPPSVASTLTDRTSSAMGTYTYTYTSRPRALPCQRRRYRDHLMQLAEEPVHHGNIMYDRRVVRGNTYALHTGPLPGQPDPIEIQRQQQAKRRALAKKRAQEQFRPRTPEPVEGRKHVDVQTEMYLEEIADRIIEVDVECQTDAFLDRPPTPLFIPAKTGKDVATQILEGELFDFDLEVKPMLEVLVGKTIEQSLLEVMEEEELANLRASQYAYEELRNVELAEVQRLAEQEKRHREEKERRKRQQWEVVYKHGETAQKVAARVFAQRYLADLLPSVFDSLRDGGYFYDPVERDIEIGFLPWLMNEVDKTMEYSMVGRTVLDMLIREVVEKRLAAYEQRDDQPPAGKPKDELGGSGRTTEPPVGYELQEQSTAQPQRPLLGRDSLQRTPDDGRYMESVLAQETKLMEEVEYEQTKIRKTSGTEVLQPRGDFQP